MPQPIKVWTPEEDARLRRLIAEGKKTDEIAAEMGRSRVAIIRYQRKNKIRYKAKVINTGRSALSARQKDKYKEWNARFVKSDRYKKLSKLLTQDDLKRFTQDWIIYHVQLEDMTAAEEDHLENMLFIKIRMEDNQKSLKQATEKEDQLREQFGGRLDHDLDPENQQDHMLYELIQSVNSMKRDINVEFLKLEVSFKEAQRSLNVSREQREKNSKVGADTFFSLIKMLTDKEQRERIGRKEGLFELSRQKKEKELKTPHKFENGDIEPIVLDGRDFLDPASVPEFTKMPVVTPLDTEGPNE